MNDIPYKGFAIRVRFLEVVEVLLENDIERIEFSLHNLIFGREGTQLEHEK